MKRRNFLGRVAGAVAAACAAPLMPTERLPLVDECGGDVSWEWTECLPVMEPQEGDVVLGYANLDYYRQCRRAGIVLDVELVDHTIRMN